MHGTDLEGDPLAALEAKLMRRTDDPLTNEGVLNALGWLLRLETPDKGLRLLAINKVAMAAIALFFRDCGGPGFSPRPWPEIDKKDYLSDEEVDELFLDELRKELTKRGEATTGKRQVLLARLKDSVKRTMKRTLPGLEVNPFGVCVNLQLPNNNLNGSLHRDVFSTKVMTSLHILDLSFNKGLRGTIPSTLSLLPLCHTLRLNNCSFTGTIPSGIATMGSLKRLDLSNNSLSGSLPPRFVDLKKLQSMDVSFNKYGVLHG